MSCQKAQAAAHDALKAGKALLKFIAPNDAGATQSHQAGILLPKAAWPLFAPEPPAAGENRAYPLRITWPDGRVTESKVTWYGRAKSEFRLTRFGRGFPYLSEDSVGSLLVLALPGDGVASAHILDTDEDMEEVAAALGVALGPIWAAYGIGSAAVSPAEQSMEDCLDARFRPLWEKLIDYPPTMEVYQAARKAIAQCRQGFDDLSSDDRLVLGSEAEFRLFCQIESHLEMPRIKKGFATIDEFLERSQTVGQRRKSRAGRSLELHVSDILRAAGIPHEPGQPKMDDTDIVIPSVKALRANDFEHRPVVGLAVKTTCRDRWRQVINEAKQIGTRHLLTLQPTIGTKDLAGMRANNIQLVVPASRHKTYPKEEQPRLMTVEQLLEHCRRVVAKNG